MLELQSRIKTLLVPIMAPFGAITGPSRGQVGPKLANVTESWANLVLKSHSEVHRIAYGVLFTVKHLR